MIDRDAPSTRAALEELAKPGVREKLVKFAVRRMHSESDAEDLLVDGEVRILGYQVRLVRTIVVGSALFASE
jgi:hypothetical protein